MESKSHKLYYTIGEVAEILGESTSLIRYWEQQFDALKPRRSQGGTRHYTQDDISVLRSIHHMVKNQGLTIRGAREKLHEQSRVERTRMQTVKILEELKGMLLQIGASLDKEEGTSADAAPSRPSQ